MREIPNYLDVNHLRMWIVMDIEFAICSTFPNPYHLTTEFERLQITVNIFHPYQSGDDVLLCAICITAEPIQIKWLEDTA